MALPTPTITVPGVIATVTEDVREVNVRDLAATGKLVHNASLKMFWVAINNSRSSAAVFVKLYDKATAPDHVTEDPEHSLKVAAGGTGTIRWHAYSQFGSGLGMAASLSAALDGADPVIPPDINIGFS